MAKNIISVLIVDDSLLFRELVKNEISKDDSIRVVATAGDPFVARDKIIEFKPQVVVLDVEMPKMTGIEFLKRLMPQYPIPVVVMSSVFENVFEAMKSGAVDFVKKPDSTDCNKSNNFINELLIKIKIASIAKVGHLKQENTSPIKLSTPRTFIDRQESKEVSDEKVIAIGASTGGTEAIASIIKALPKETPGIVVVQHMPPVFTNMYAERLNNTCDLFVKEAEDGDMITKGKVLIAPGDYQVKVVKKGKSYFVECFKGEKVNGHCPSVDVLFNSVAEKIRANAIGVILTGMGADGAAGLLNMRKNGAKTIGQDEKTCVVYGMPKVAYDIGAVMEQAPIEKIPGAIYSLCSKEYI